MPAPIDIKFCNVCGRPVEVKVPDGDHQPRHVCVACGTIQYRNPKTVVGCIPEWEDRILMCRRAIEPRLGKWTFPAGFLEMGETIAQGAAREALEEAQARVAVEDLFAAISVSYVSQLYLVFRGKLAEPAFGPTHESSEVVLMREDEIPWEEIAFPTIWHSLKFFFADRAAGRRGFHSLDLTVPTRRPELPPEPR